MGFLQDTGARPLRVPVPPGRHVVCARLSDGGRQLAEAVAEVDVQPGEWLDLECRPVRGRTISGRQPELTVRQVELTAWQRLLDLV